MTKDDKRVALATGTHRGIGYAMAKRPAPFPDGGPSGGFFSERKQIPW